MPTIDAAFPPGLVVVPAREWLWTQSAIAIYNLRLPRGSFILWDPGGATLDLKRNNLIQEFLALPELVRLAGVD